MNFRGKIQKQLEFNNACKKRTDAFSTCKKKKTGCPVSMAIRIRNWVPPANRDFLRHTKENVVTCPWDASEARLSSATWTTENKNLHSTCHFLTRRDRGATAAGTSPDRSERAKSRLLWWRDCSPKWHPLRGMLSEMAPADARKLLHRDQHRNIKHQCPLCLGIF